MSSNGCGINDLVLVPFFFDSQSNRVSFLFLLIRLDTIFVPVSICFWF